MKDTTKHRLNNGLAIAAVAGVIAAAAWAGTAFNTAPAPKPTPSPTSSRMIVDEIPDFIPQNADRLMDDQNREAVVPAPAPEDNAPQTPTAPLEGTSDPGSTPTQPSTPVEQAPAPAPEPEPEPAPAPPVLCAGGSTSVASDGYNDTGCLPNECFSVILPDPAYPQCDAPFRP